MEILGLPVIVLVMGLLGYVWKLRNELASALPGVDEEFVDTVEGMCEQFGVKPDEIAKKSQGKFKKQLFGK